MRLDHPGVPRPASPSALRLRHGWWMLAVLIVSAQISVAATTQDGFASTLISLLVWGGAWLCLEEEIPGLLLHPSWLGLLLGTALLTAGLERLSRIQHLDGVTLLFPLWLGAGLMLLWRPLIQLAPWRSPWLRALAVLTLPPMAHLLQGALPESLFASLTGRSCQLILLLLGFDASSSGNKLQLQGGGVEIVSACTGVELITEMVVVAFILLLAFPLPGTLSRLQAVAAAPLVAFAVNVGRITLLALIHASGLPQRQWWFDFFHKDGGSLLFAALAASLYGWLYLLLMEAALRRRSHG